IDFGRGQSIMGQDGSNTDGIPQDRLYFRSQVYGEEDTLTNCSGSDLGGTTIFYIDDATKSLQCVFNGARTPLVNNVVGMDISYKVDMVEFSPDNPQALMTATQIEEYNTAAAAASTAFLRPRNLWNRVIGVKIDFLLRSQNTNITTETQSINFNGVTATPDENRLFRTFSTAVMLRNSPGVNSSELLDD
ncbi:MAG: PilW family protein, partial [Gammaproteobacteria bacterium]